jgi:hypothetical protein
VPLALFFSTSIFSERIQMFRPVGFVDAFGLFCLHTLTGLAVGSLIGCLIYVVGFHLTSIYAAKNLRLVVEGAYLRLVTGSVFPIDYRLHFKDLRDYTIYSGPVLSRFGLGMLSFRISNSPQSIRYYVVGLVDANKVRDHLCEIDSARENRLNWFPASSKVLRLGLWNRVVAELARVQEVLSERILG